MKTKTTKTVWSVRATLNDRSFADLILFRTAKSALRHVLKLINQDAGTMLGIVRYEVIPLTVHP